MIYLAVEHMGFNWLVFSDMASEAANQWEACEKPC